MNDDIAVVAVLGNFAGYAGDLPSADPTASNLTTCERTVMNLRMPETLRRAYLSELEKYHEALRSGRLHDAWTFLERAHVVGQYHPLPHAAVHARMLVFALRNGDGREALGQLPRLAVGWLGSLLNRVPVGNTGGANVPILASMPIPEDLSDVLSNADTGQSRLAGLKG